MKLSRINLGLYCVIVIYGAHLFGLFDQLAASFPLKLAMKSDSSFGKTHFIVGYQGTRKPAGVTSQQQPVDLTSLTYTALFSPHDDVRGALLDLIEHEQVSVKIAMFTCTDDIIARALIKAHNRGIEVECVIDNVCLKDRNNKVALLCEQGIKMWVYNASDATGHKINGSCMHHKFVLFECNRSDHSLVWTGSCNATKSAYQFNQENVVIIQNNALYDRFAMQFDRIKKRSYRYGRRS